MPQRSYKAVFFDLDGTLLPIDMDTFLKNYFEDIAVFVQSRGYDPKRFIDALNAGVKSMLVETGGLNSERFWRTFSSRMGADSLDEYQNVMDEYYSIHFDSLGAMATNIDPNAAYVVKTLKEKGYPLYLTTMPLFPRIAVEKRLAWANVPAESFDRITTYDNSTSTKPHRAYFAENVKAIGLKPEEILMVGNNTREDLAAMELGLDAYLVTDWLLDPDGFDIESVKHGTLADFARFVDELPECE